MEFTEEVLKKIKVNEHFVLAHVKIREFGISFIRAETPYGSLCFYGDSCTVNERVFGFVNGELIEKKL